MQASQVESRSPVVQKSPQGVLQLATQAQLARFSSNVADFPAHTFCPRKSPCWTAVAQEVQAPPPLPPLLLEPPLVTPP